MQRRYGKILSELTIGNNIKNLKYAVKGEIVVQGEAIRNEMMKGKKFPFQKLFPCNIGDPIIHGQKTFTFNREVMAATLFPELIKSSSISQDAKDRASYYCKNTGHGGVGAYTDSAGLLFIRESVRKFFQRRDDLDANVSHIFLGNGASDIVSTLLNIVFSKPGDGVNFHS